MRLRKPKTGKGLVVALALLLGAGPATAEGVEIERVKPARCTVDRPTGILRGRATDVDPEDHRVVVYALTDQWYIQPDLGQAHRIRRSGRFKSRVYCGIEYAAVLVRRDFVPDDETSQLPLVDGVNVLAVDHEHRDGDRPADPVLTGSIEIRKAKNRRCDLGAPKSKIQGIVHGGSRSDQRVVLYAGTDQWYVQPFLGFTHRMRRGHWKTRSHCGEQFAALLVVRGYVPESTLPLDGLPAVDGVDVLDVDVLGPIPLD